MFWLSIFSISSRYHPVDVEWGEKCRLLRLNLFAIEQSIKSLQSYNFFLKYANLFLRNNKVLNIFYKSCGIN